MPSVDAPDIRKGFWLTVGVVLALVIVSLVRAVVQRGTRAARPRP